jgi:tetratricopeptide (TPR) repeat protein
MMLNYKSVFLTDDLESHKKLNRFFRKYVKPTFKPIQLVGTDIDNTENLSFNYVFRMIFKSNPVSPILFVCAEAGMGKTAFMRYVAYRLMLKHYDINKVFIAKFNEYTNIDNIVSDLKAKRSNGAMYVLLDGFDEFPGVYDKKPETVLENLFKKIAENTDGFSKIVISCRIDMLVAGGNELKKLRCTMPGGNGVAKAKKPVEIIQMQYFCRKQIVKTFNLMSALRKDPLVWDFKRQIKKYLKKSYDNDRESIFRIPFFIYYAEEIWRESRLKEFKHLTQESALHLVVNKCIEKEYYLFNKSRDGKCFNIPLEDQKRLLVGKKQIQGGQHDKAEEIVNNLEDEDIERSLFEMALNDALTQIAIFLSKEKWQYINWKDVEGIYIETYKSFQINYNKDDTGSKESKDVLSSRTLLVSENEKYRFQHRLFLEYYAVQGLLKGDNQFTLANRRTLFGKYGSSKTYSFFNEIKNIYAYALAYDPILRAGLKGSLVGIDKCAGMLELLQQRQIHAVENPAWDVRRILRTLPLADEFRYKNYRLTGSAYSGTFEDIDDTMLSYTDDGALYIRNQCITSLNGIEAFGKIDKLDVRDNEIKDFNCLHKHNRRLDWMAVSSCSLEYIPDDIEIGRVLAEIANPEQLEQLLNHRNIGAFSVDIGDDAENLPDLFAFLRTAISSGTVGCSLVITHFASYEAIKHTVQQINDSEDAIGLFNSQIEFLDNALHLIKCAYLPESKARELESVKLLTAQYYNNRGISYRKLEEYGKVVADYTKAIELNPDDAVYYGNRGFSYAKLEEHEKAVEDYTKTIELRPDNAALYDNRGSSYDKLEEHEKAVEDYTKAIELRPDEGAYYSKRGSSYFELKEYGKVVADYTKAIELRPDGAVLYGNRGFSYAKLEEHEKAVEDYTKAIELRPDEGVYYSQRGSSYFELKEYGKVVEDYTKAIELNPDDAVYYNNRGFNYGKLEEYGKAVEDYTKAIELNPDDAVYYGNRGDCYYELKEYEKAAADRTKAMELDPDNADHK